MMSRHLLLLTIILCVTESGSALAAEEVLLDTEVTYVGERYWFKARLPGIWRYALSDTEDGIQLAQSSVDEGGPVYGQTITIAEKTAFAEWPQGHQAQWAADAYRQWELENMKSEGVETGMYRLRDTKMSEEIFNDKRFFTLTYKQLIKNPFIRDVTNHAFLFLYFPDDYETSQRFYWIHFLQARDKADRARPSLDLVHNVISGLFLDRDGAPAQTNISWSSPDNVHVYVSVPGKHRTHYFNNNNQRQCYSFNMAGIWYPASHHGLFISGNQYDHGGITLLSKDDLKEFEGENLIAKAANCEIGDLEASGEAKVEEFTVEPLACIFPDTVKWTADFSLKLFGQKVMGKNVWYISEVKPGWVGIVTAVQGTNTGDDDMARELFEALVFSHDAHCFRDEIGRLVK